MDDDDFARRSGGFALATPALCALLALGSVACGPRGVLGDGQPPSCRAIETACNGACVRLTIDPRNCGACGTTCPGGQFCDNGACVAACAPGRTVCANGCVELATDPAHCGACGTACGPAARCVAGACVSGCAPTETLCGGACVITATDNNNCGACGTVCPAGQACQGSRCVTGGGGGGGPLCPNEPGGYTTAVDTAWNELPAAMPDFSAGGWQLVDTTAGALSIIMDPAAPRSPPNALRVALPMGLAPGSTTAHARSRPFVSNTGSVYVCFSARFDTNLLPVGSGGTVALFGPRAAALSGVAHMVTVFAGMNPPSPLWIGAQTRFAGGMPAGDAYGRAMENNVGGGGWRRIEMLWGANAPGATDGVFRVWIDGAQTTDTRNARWFDTGQTARWDSFVIEPGYDGMMAVPDATGLAIDHLYVSVH